MHNKCTPAIHYPRLLLTLTLLIINYLSFAQYPGGVKKSITMWLRSDSGLTVAGGNVNQWNEISGANVTGPFVAMPTLHASSNQTPPTLVAGGINFNAYIRFNGVNNSLASRNVFTGSQLVNNNIKAVTVFQVINMKGGTVWLKWESDIAGTLARLGFEHNPTFNSIRYDFPESDGFPNGQNIGNTSTLNKNTLSTCYANIDSSFNKINGLLDNAISLAGVTGDFSQNSDYMTLGNDLLLDLPAQIDIAEEIIYARTLSAAERNKVETYLAVKYGFTLNQAAANNNSYTASDGTIIWNRASNANYAKNITGIGRDDASLLSQLQSKSNNTGVNGLVTIYNDSTYAGGVFPTLNSANTNTFPNNLTYVLFGDNGKAATALNTCVYSGKAHSVARVWKVGQMGTPVPVTLSVDNGGVPATATNLLVSSDSTFPAGSTTIYPLTRANGKIYTSVTLLKDQFFTYASDTVIVNIAVVQPSCTNTSDTITASETGGIFPISYSWNTTPVQTTNPAVNVPAGNYVLTFTNNTCKSIYPVTVTQGSSVALKTTAMPDTICNGSSTQLSVASQGGALTSYTWAPGGQTGTTISVSPKVTTQYSVFGSDSTGCTDTGKVTVVVNTPTTSITNGSLCPGNSFIFNGKAYDSAGTYIDTLPSASGCDSIATLVLTVISPSFSTTDTSICSGSLPFSWNAKLYDSAGTYMDTMVNAVGCDSIATLVLTINHPSFHTDSVTACGSYTWNGTTYTASGTYDTVFVKGSSGGCDSTAKLVLTMGNPIVHSDTVTACGSYTWNGTAYTTSGTYDTTIVKGSSGGCDSTAILVLTISNSIVKSSTVAACGGYTWNGTTYTASGTYDTTIVKGSSSGCDSTSILVLTINNPTFHSDTASACTSYIWNGKTYTTSGTYDTVLVKGSSSGCDSTATLVLTINSPAFHSDTVAACTSYAWNGSTYTTSGTYDTVFVKGSSSGCDSTATLVLTINQPSFYTKTDTACGSYTWNGVAYTASGTYDTVFVKGNSHGCDSTATLVLTINQPSFYTKTDTACGSYTWNGVAYTASGTYDTVFVKGNSHGCDSTATLVLTISKPSSHTDTVTTCRSYPWNGNVYTRSGTYDTVFVKGNSLGCDSTAKLLLTIGKATTSTTPVSICAAALPYIWNGKSYSTPGTYTFDTTNATGCDSTATLVLAVNQPSSYTKYDSICAGNTYFFNGVGYDSAGTYTSPPLVNAAGCDSTVTLVLAVRQPSSSTTDTSICAGKSFTFNGVVYRAAGNYVVHFNNSVGCDSAANLVLTVNGPPAVPPIVAITDTIVCVGNSIGYTDALPGGTWGSQKPSIAKVDSSSGGITGVAYGNTYIKYTVTNSCGTDSQEKGVHVSGSPQVNVNRKLAGPTCLYPLSGSVQLYITGPEPSYTFTLGGNSYNDSTTVTGLGEGTYPVYIYNSDQCLVAGIPLLSLAAPLDASCDTLYVPTGFMPGSQANGVNGRLKPFGGILLKSLSFRVYNRYGTIVYESHDIYQGWDGSVNGTAQQTGTYVWFLDYTTMDGTRRTSKGTSVLIR